MDKLKLLNRTKILISVILAVLVIFSYFIITKSSLIRGLNLETDELRDSLIAEHYRNETFEGDIVDTNGIILSECMEAGQGGVLVFPEEYSWLLGYNDPTYGSYGLKGMYENYLYMQGKEKQGATIKLTIDNELQLLAYDLIQGTEGSLIVLEKDTGKILALASSKPDEFNANELSEENMTYWNSIDGFFLANGYKDAGEPGSTFKVVMASALIEADMQDEIYYDTGVLPIDDDEVINASRKAYGEINLQSALGYSSNVYFAQKVSEIGGAVLKAKAEEYLLGESIELDFTTLKSNLDMGSYAERLVADTSYGQGNTLITPLHLAMIFQSIGNNGKMLKPYLVESIELDGKHFYKGKKEVLTKTLEESVAQTLDGYLKNVATNYYNIGDEQIRAKTGTAQIPGNRVKYYFASYSDKYVVVVNRVANDGYGYQLKDEALEIYNYLKYKKNK